MEGFMKKISRLIILIFVIVFLLKCAAGQSPLRKSVEIDEDRNDKVATIIGIEEKIGSPKALNYSFIRSFIYKESGHVIHQICACYGYTGKDWRFYTSAYGQNGRPLQIVEIDREADYQESINVYHETIGVTVTDEYLKSNLNGFTIRVLAISGDSLILEPTTKQIKSQLNKIREYKKLHGL
jgi:hypothetical protein